MKYLYGIITDGCSQWNIIRRRNCQRNIAKDVLNDPLLIKNKHFDINNILDGDHENIFNQTAAALAHERWQLFKTRYNDQFDDGFLREKALYDGYVLECDLSKS